MLKSSNCVLGFNINMIKKIYIISFAMLAFSCSKENPVGYVGQPVSVSIDIPDESEDLEFLWELTSIPSNSYLINTDIQAGQDNFSVNICYVNTFYVNNFYVHVFCVSKCK